MTIREEAFAGLPISCPVIDAHNHTGISNNTGWHQYQKHVATSKVVEDISRLGIDCIISAPHCLIYGYMEDANRIAAEEAAQFPGKIYGYISVIPWCGMDRVRQQIQQYAANPSFVGLKFLAGYHGEVIQPEYEYAMDFADEVGCPVLCHEWANVPDRKGFEIALQTRHNMKLIIAHQGGGSAEHTRACAPIITNNANAYMELCGSLDNRLGVEDIVDLVGAEKVIFGTDAIDLDPKYELGKVAFSPLDDRIKKMIFAENYLSLLEGSQMGKITL